jgi:DNA-binding phage protein
MKNGLSKKAKTQGLYSTFEVAEKLSNETVIAEYLSLAAQDQNSDVLTMALSDMAKARTEKHSARQS